MRFLTVALAGILMLAPVSLAGHGQTTDDKTVTFDHRTGNEWWVEVVLGGPSAGTVTGVQAMDNGGPWVQLEKKSWGAWAASFHIEPGNDVRFLATWADGDSVESCWFTHPEGMEQCEAASDERVAAATYVSAGMGGFERVHDLAVDAQGNAYVAANTGTGLWDTNDALIAKYRPDGSLDWQTRLGGSAADFARSVDVGDDGHVYVGGDTDSTDFPAAGWQTQHGGEQDAWVAKLSPSGDLMWATLIGGDLNDHLNDLEVDAQGHVTAAGFTNSCDFPTHGPAFQPESPEGCAVVVDGFVVRLTKDGQSAVFSTYLAGNDQDILEDIAVEADGTIHITGHTRSPDFPVTADAVQPVYGGRTDAFYAVMSPLSELEYSTFLGGDEQDQAHGVALHPDGGAVLVGESFSADYPTTSGAVQPDHSGGNECPRQTSGGPDPTFEDRPCADIVVTHIGPGGTIGYSTFFGTQEFERANGVSLDSDGRIHVAGNTLALPGEEEPIGGGGGFEDGFLLLLSPGATEVERAIRIGGDDGDFGEETAPGPDGSVWYAGWTWSEDLPTTEGAHQRQSDGQEDGYLLRLEGPSAAPQLTFDHRGGNEWWVQVRIDGETPGRVQAMDTGGPWTELTLRDWGDWAASFHIEPGHDVRFRAMVDDAWRESCWFTHPEGVTPDGGTTCGVQGGAPPPPPPGEFDATFRTPGGNEWWVEVYVESEDPIAAVHAREDGGPWMALQKRSWGAWAGSFHVEDGSLVQFRATNGDGETDLSGEYRWPEGTQVSDSPDGGDGGDGGGGDGGGTGEDETLDAAFAPKAGNEWWVEALVISEADLVKVEGRADGGAWHEMTWRDWGAYAASFHAPSGSTVEFRATDAEGRTDVSDGFRWTDAVPVDDPNGAWPQEGSYARYETEDHSSGGSQELNATFVFHDDAWHLYCDGVTYFRSEPQPHEVYTQQDLPLAPTDVAPGDMVSVMEAACAPCCRTQGLEVTVRGQDSAAVHREGDAVTVATWTGDRDADGSDHEAEWDQAVGVLTDWRVVHDDGASGMGRLLDTDAPIG